MIGRIARAVSTRGVGYAAGRAVFAAATLTNRLSMPRRLNEPEIWSRALEGARLLEIGGKSAVFNVDGPLPAYRLAASVDNVNFGDETVWEGKIEAGRTFAYAEDRQPGLQFVCEARRLTPISDGEYDGVISSHMLEHSANPLAVLREWMRVVRPGGAVLVLVPWKSVTFDRRRPLTTVAHMKEDFDRDRGEDDMTHAQEVLRLHDIAGDWQLSDKAELKIRVADNHRNRCLHHHTFDERTLAELMRLAGLRSVRTQRLAPLHIVGLGTKGED